MAKLDLNFQGHNTIKMVKISISCILSSESGDPLLFLFVCLFCCFTSQVNSYGHGGTVS